MGHGGITQFPLVYGLQKGKSAAVRTADFHYDLPEELIAQEPAARREASRLLVFHRDGSPLEHRLFPDLADYLRAGDVLVVNNSKVIPARLRGVNARTGGEFEILLLEENGPNDWWALMRPGKRARLGTEIRLKAPNPDATPAPAPPVARVIGLNAEGHRRLLFSGPALINTCLERLGETPLPPYINRPSPNLRPDDRERYQTVYARPEGSVAAPTAGLHFTQAFMEALGARGVAVVPVTLHVGLGTFAPVKTERLDEHTMHEERFHVSAEAAAALNAARAAGRRVIAVGTTSVRVLETLAARHEGRIEPGEGRTRIFIRPPCKFGFVDGLVTNFHLPCSTLLMLVSALASPGEERGREAMLAAYGEAVRRRYRFFSYGDAMLIL